MYKVKTMDNIAQIGLKGFEADKYEYGNDVAEPDAIILRSRNIKDMAGNYPASLACIARAGAGVNNIPVDDCGHAGIVVFNTPGANANGVKELALCALLLASRGIIEGVNWANAELADKGADVPALVEKGKKAFGGYEIQGKRLGVIGLGAIGVMVANAATALGMEVVGSDPYISIDSAWKLSRNIKRASGNREIFETCDYITLHAPLTPETTATLNEAAFEGMKKGMRIVNTSRGELVDNAALLKAIENGIVERYVTDFPNAEMLGNPKIIAIPHLGASTEESEDNCAVMAVNEIREFLETGNIVNSVNYPNCSMERACDKRICVAHANKPNMLAQINASVGSLDINIEDMINKSKGEYGYTVLEINGNGVDKAAELIKQIKGVYKVRVIG